MSLTVCLEDWRLPNHAAPPDGGLQVLGDARALGGPPRVTGQR